MDINMLTALISIAIAIATFFLGRLTSHRNEGKAEGELRANIVSIKETVERLERQFDRSIDRLEGRVDEISAQLSEVGTQATKAGESAKSAHHRIDGINDTLKMDRRQAQ